MNYELKLKKINDISRYSLSFVFFYHGMIPNIIWLDATEILLVKAHNLPFNNELVSLVGGVFEIVLAFIILLYKKSLKPVYLAIIVLTMLLIDVAIIQPDLLIKAFNPVTINLTGITLCIITIISYKEPLA